MITGPFILFFQSDREDSLPLSEAIPRSELRGLSIIRFLFFMHFFALIDIIRELHQTVREMNAINYYIFAQRQK